METFEVTHPFHPRRGRRYSLVTYRKNWGEDHVYFEDEDGRPVSLPARWTSVLPPEPLVAVAQGQSEFRIDDLLELAALVERIDKQLADAEPPDV